MSNRIDPNKTHLFLLSDFELKLLQLAVADLRRSAEPDGPEGCMLLPILQLEDRLLHPEQSALVNFTHQLN